MVLGCYVCRCLPAHSTCQRCSGRFSSATRLMLSYSNVVNEWGSDSSEERAGVLDGAAVDLDDFRQSSTEHFGAL